MWINGYISQYIISYNVWFWKILYMANKFSLIYEQFVLHHQTRWSVLLRISYHYSRRWGSAVSVYPGIKESLVFANVFCQRRVMKPVMSSEKHALSRSFVKSISPSHRQNYSSKALESSSDTLSLELNFSYAVLRVTWKTETEVVR